MKIKRFLAPLFVVVLAVSFISGCASTPKDGAGTMEDQAKAAIAAASAAISKAASVGGEWRNSKKILGKAKKALKKGDFKKAIKIANKAKRQGELGYAQAMAEKNSRGQKFLGGGGGTAGDYTVASGDSLWSISGKSSVYGNAYQWPLIYKANKGSIKDADLIYPGQNFSIDRNASSADVDAAVAHAKTRGAWSVGTVEESDLKYLGQ
ncbi:MAG: hypothetical protein BMS9Abin26_0986 [Gammaproteobacteria bacterium]|nr:MAG: hypothetical protein BMS9Abin26_0986 [Gammaproteobacteria bacterium]